MIDPLMEMNESIEKVIGKYNPQKDMADLKKTSLIHLKGFLFFVILAVSSTGILIQYFNFLTLFFLCLVIWSSARLYYYFFYVIENYVDSAFKFSGLFSAIKYLFLKK